MDHENTQQPEIIAEISQEQTPEECEYHSHEQSSGQGEGLVSSAEAIEAALKYWREILTDEKASDTAKMNAANGLARFGQAEMGSHGGKLHQMTREELQAEIAKTRKSLGLV